MSDYTYTVTSTAAGDYEPPVNPLSQVTEQQLKENYCFIVAPGDEVVFFKSPDIWKQAETILKGYQYKVFYCMEVLRFVRLKNTK
jgi:hypothetical protein